MSRIKRLLKKVDKIVNNINIQDVIDKMQDDIDDELQLQQRKMNVYYDINNEKYKINNRKIYNNYKNYNDYNIGEDLWTSLKAS